MAVLRWFLLLPLFSLHGCRAKETVADAEPAAPPSAAASTSLPISPLPEKVVAAARNPSGEAPYSGPIGSVRGTIRVSGDPAPEDPEILAHPPKPRCADARAFYGKVFREGPGRTLADVLVAVTEYPGYVPPASEVKNVTIRGCAYESRTIAMVFGQRLDVWNKGGETFMPTLLGSNQAALVVAMPGGEPVRLFPVHVGQYTLTDQSHEYAKAETFVLKFPTFAVTGLDGTYEIRGIPVGEVSVTAQLPATRGTAQQRVKIVAGEAATVDLTIPFSLRGTAAAPSGSAGAAPAH